MAIYKRNAVFPDWEPVPWTKVWSAADRQEEGFHERALKQIAWQKIRWEDLPEGGIFGHQKDWLQSKDISHFTTLNGEDLFLIDNTWFGFPDPPRWGLVSRLPVQNELPWQHWGHFPDLPTAWQLEVQ
ncbi:hypothetical protein [Sphingorhabdus sp. EL138]|uniref:hypothetical protein n=1 Tax=Sphingorhabdus sp. EL138 TaxID=2073156 RepID=UPI000D68B620|nr:hypothetical protein [Sphingorhabdus sp. EL138]